MDDLDFEAQLRAYDERHERRQIATLQRVEQHDRQIDEIRAATERIKAESEQEIAEIDRQIASIKRQTASIKRQTDEIRAATRRSKAESEQRNAESEQRNAEIDRKLKESDRRFWERLDLFDQQNTALLRRLEQLRERVDLLSGDSRQITDSLVEHKRDPEAHG